MRLKKTINNVYECAPNAHTRTYLKPSMKNLLTLLLFVSGFGIGAMAGSSSDVYFEADFEKGIPRDFTVLDRDENPSKIGVSNIDLTGGSWTTAYYAKGHRAAMSSAYCTYDYGVDDWLILPQINIKDFEAILTWEAMSVHYDFREDYKVMISESGTKPSDFVEVYSVTAEDYYARRHAISLEQYYGKDIYVAFVHTGCDKFLLAIDNIKVGVWENEHMLINNTDKKIDLSELSRIVTKRTLSDYKTAKEKCTMSTNKFSEYLCARIERWKVGLMLTQEMFDNKMRQICLDRRSPALPLR